MRALCLHGHFYQPPREHPWLGVVEPDPSAAPARDWNTRIAAECYAPYAAARVLDQAGRLTDVVDLYRWTSFDFGPTLLGWLAGQRPDLMAAVCAADAASTARTGSGNAWAQAYGHAILPLSSARDVRTQVLWGAADFAHRFRRPADGMWLPEMAVDRTSLVALAHAGIGLTMLSPHQARRVRPLGAGDDAWREVTAASLDTRQLYRCVPAPGLAVDICFRDAALSHDLAFNGLLTDGATVAARLGAELAGAPEEAILCLAVDGETYGHHHRFAEMALAFAVRALAADPHLQLVGPAAYRAAHPPVLEVEIAERTSWSCEHGVERWRTDCGCRVGSARSSQAWRFPLRQAIDWLRDQLAVFYEAEAGQVLRDPWGARDRYLECVLAPERTAAFLATHVAGAAAGTLSVPASVQARRCLELARHALLMQTSCGWFFDALDGVEPALILRQAARAIELAGALGGRFEDGFVSRLEPARGEHPSSGSGADMYRRTVRRAGATPARVAATSALMRALDAAADVPGYDVAWGQVSTNGRAASDALVRERSTGAEAAVQVVVERAPDGHVRCRAGDAVYGVGDLFAVQQERLLALLADEASGAERATRQRTLAQVAPVLAPLRTADAVVPAALATLLGWEQAETIATAVASHASLARLTTETAALRRRGVPLPVEWLAPHLTRALEERVAGLPATAPACLVLLDLAAAAGAPLDLERAQRVALAWWRTAPAPGRTSTAVTALWGRLWLAPEAVPA